MDLLPLTFDITLSLNPNGKIQQILKLIRELRMRIIVLKYVISKYYKIVVLMHQLYV